MSLIITRVEQRAINYTVQRLNDKKQIGYIKWSVSDGEYIFQAQFESTLTTLETEELLRHLKEINKAQ
jgi:hypothetical protein